jgi:hypothetical protein
MAVPAYIRSGVKTVFSAPDDATTFIANNSGTVLTKAVNADGDVTIASTDAVSTGRYQYLFTDSDGELVESGVFHGLPSLATGDPRSWAEIALAAVEAAISGRATQNQRSVAVGDKNIGYMSHSELIAARAMLLDLVEQEQMAIAGTNGLTYHANFSRMSI